MFCTKCGKELGEGEKFCSDCGERVGKGEVEFNDIVSSVSAKAKEGASYAADQLKHIDVSDAKGIFTNVTKMDSIVYLIVGVLLFLVSIYSVFGSYYRAMRMILSMLLLILPAFLGVYFFVTDKTKKGIISSSQVFLGIMTILLLLSLFGWLPGILYKLRNLICIVIGATLAAVGTIKLCKDLEQNKTVGVSNQAVAGNANMNETPNIQGMNNINMGGVLIANYDARFDYTPIGMWGYFLYSILFNIPLIGWICWIIFAVGGTRNINLRNFARSYICLYIVMFVLFLLISLFVAALF